MSTHDSDDYDSIDRLTAPEDLSRWSMEPRADSPIHDAGTTVATDGGTDEMEDGEDA